MSALDEHDRYKAVGGRRVRWRECGNADAEPLVFLHGSWLAAAFCDTLLERLATTRHVYALDQRGHGETDHAADYSWPLWVEDITVSADQVGLGRFDLVGHSMGAVNALSFAARHPDRVHRLVLLEGGFGEINSPRQGEFWTNAFRLNPEDDFEGLDAFIAWV